MEQTTVILKNMGSSDKKRVPDCWESNVATTLLSRDYKGLSNFASNGVIEVLIKDNEDMIRLGNIYGSQFGTGYAGNVWDSRYLCPSLMTMQGGGRQPHVIEVINEQHT